MTAGDQFYFVHRLPRRTRLKVPRRRGDRVFFADLRRRLEACSGVVSVSAAPEAASIVVNHVPDFDWSTVRLDAMRLREADPDACCTCVCHRCEPAGNRIEFGNLCEWTLRLMLSGQPVAHLAGSLASGIIRSALNDLVAAGAARG